MKLLLEINEAATQLLETTTFVTKNLQYVVKTADVDVDQLDEAATQFINGYARAIANGKLKEQDKDRVITIFGALKALTQMDIAQSFTGNDETQAVALTNDDKDALPLGSVLTNFYGANEEKSKIAEHRLVQIGNHPSVASYKAMADKAVNDPNSITEFAGKIQTTIEPVMNTLISQERQHATSRLRNKQEKSQQEQMARPMQGVVPQRS